LPLKSKCFHLQLWNFICRCTLMSSTRHTHFGSLGQRSRSLWPLKKFWQAFAAERGTRYAVLLLMYYYININSKLAKFLHMSWFITVAFNKQLENPQKEVIYKFILKFIAWKWIGVGILKVKFLEIGTVKLPEIHSVCRKYVVLNKYVQYMHFITLQVT